MVRSIHHKNSGIPFTPEQALLKAIFNEHKTMPYRVIGKTDKDR